MKTIGLLGGMSWESTLIYYRELNEAVKRHLGGLHSAKMVLINVDFAPLEAWMSAGAWDLVAQDLIKHSHTIQQAGAEALVISTNTMHKLAPQITTAIDIPLLHIADAVGQQLVAAGHQQVGLLGTAFTMEHDFYARRLKQQFGVEVLVPEADERAIINQVIFTELCVGTLNTDSKQQYLDIIDRLSDRGAQAVILGCTEIGLLVEQADTAVPLVDATYCHIDAIAEFVLS